jgi:hypothetical protein
VTLFVLGAGATRACSFVDASKSPCIPPLDADFFTQLQRVRNPKHQSLISDVMKDVVAIFGHNFSVSLETVFATLEHTIRMIKTTGSKRAFKVKDLEGMRDRLLQAIAVVMEESITEPGKSGASTQTPRTCEHFKRLVRDRLQKSDDIISFNYDCVIDHALREYGDGKWNARHGYGFGLGPRGSSLSGDEHWSPKSPSTKSETVHLYKLHGSLHFKWDSDSAPRVTLKQRPYTKQNGTPRFRIIPPESNKAYDKGLFAGLWKDAAAAIGRAKCVIVVGYSLPPTDMHATALFRTSIKPGALHSLVVVNPDREARRRTRSVLQRGLANTTRVLSCDTLTEFLALDPSTWMRGPAMPGPGVSAAAAVEATEEGLEPS